MHGSIRGLSAMSCEAIITQLVDCNVISYSYYRIISAFFAIYFASSSIYIGKIKDILDV